MYRVRNIDNIVKTFNTSYEFIEYVRAVCKENEDSDFSILGESDAIEYIDEVCPDLTLTIEGEDEDYYSIIQRR